MLLSVPLLCGNTRLGHSNFRSIRYMSKDVCISSHRYFHDKCEVCIATKITRKPFPQIE